MASHVSEVAPIVYLESDGKPMGETGIHVDCTVGLYDMLRHHFRRGGVYVGNHLFVYYRQGDPR